jgi:hypothetical protein
MLLRFVLVMGTAAAAFAAGCHTSDEPPKLCAGQPTSAPPLDPLSEAALTATLRAHALAVSCSASGESGSDPTFMPGSGQSAVECAAIATSCQAWLSCASGGHCPDFCPDFAWVCDGDNVVVCDYLTPNGWYGTVREDCASEGMHCAQVGADATCTTGATCSPPQDYHCQGNAITRCQDGLVYSNPCGAGFSCMDFSLLGSPGAGCTSTSAPPCSGQPYCDGTVAHGCFLGSVEETLDCASPALQASCIVAFGKVECLPTASQCMPGAPDHCNGDALSTCYNGKFQDADCTAIGFRTCSAAGPGPAVCVH